MSNVKSIVPVLLLAACAPQNAQLTSGSYVAFLSDGTSLSLVKETVNPDDPSWPASYNMDCREFEDEADERNFKLDDPIQICGQNNWPPAHEQWADQAGYRVVSEDITPWRGEAVINSEGDLQIGFHHYVRGDKKSDMRLIMSVKPAFQPTTCVPRESGGVDIEPMDGDWIANWSDELAALGDLDEAYSGAYAHLEPYLDGGRLFLLNATGYQINPRDVADFWFLPPQWEAGNAQGKISEELIYHRGPRYAQPFVYNSILDPESDEGFVPINEGDLFFCDLPEGTDPAESDCVSELETEVTTVANEIHDELDRMFKPDGKDSEPIFEYRPMTHLNKWRPVDGVPAGFDGWGELHYNYIVFSADSVLEAGGQARGAFSLVLDALDSQTVVFAQGEFVLEAIKKDRWVTEDLQEVKAEENGVELCFQQ